MHKVFIRALGALTAAMLALVALVPIGASAQTTNQAPSTKVLVLPFHISGQYTATTSGVVRFAMPFPATLIGAHASARASGGTSPTLTVDVLQSGTTVLTTPMSITAGSVTYASLATTTIVDEATMTINLTIGGTSPTWNDITVFLVFVL